MHEVSISGWFSLRNEGIKGKYSWTVDVLREA
jgi:hypothetical protein